MWEVVVADQGARQYFLIFSVLILDLACGTACGLRDVPGLRDGLTGRLTGRSLIC